MDQAALHLINQQWTNSAFDLFMAALSDSAIWQPFLIGLALVATVLGGFKARACIFCILFTLLIVTQVTNALKSAINRPRPKQAQSVRLVELQKAHPKFMTLFKEPVIRFSDASDHNRSGPSFPSGHVTNNTAAAVCLTLFYRKRGWLYWIVAAAVSYSRIYLGAHWPSDVIATFFLAGGETLIVLAALQWTWAHAARKWASDVFARHPSLLAG
jgi:undecaprenyl-diphosphatase